MANKPAVNYDGASDFAARGSDLTGSSASKQITVSTWFLRTTDGNVDVFLASNSSSYDLRFTSSNYFQFSLEDNTGTVIAMFLSTTTFTADSTWHNLLVSVDLTDTGKRHIYVDGVSVSGSWTTYTNSTIDFTTINHSVGALSSGGFKAGISLSQLWMDFGVYIDFSSESNRDKFYVSGKAPDLGADGSEPAGSSPILYAPNGDPSTSTDDGNEGTGGNYTMSGAVTDVTGPESYEEDLTGPIFLSHFI